MSRKKIIIVAASFVFSGCLMFLIALKHYIASPGMESGPGRVIYIKEGSSLNKVAEDLYRKKIISNKAFFLLWGRYQGYEKKIKAGEYYVKASDSPKQLFYILTKGAVILHQITIPEGLTCEQTGELFQRNGLANKKDFLKVSRNVEIARHYGLDVPCLEGFLYPDTYKFAKGLTSSDIINVMLNRFFKVIGPEMEHVKKSGFSLEQVVILASIIEKETALSEERPIIASVFINRLKKNMRLESDPTVIFGISDFDGNLRKKDLERRSPYNTYVISGLPPGPIANPGQDALKAVLNPAKTDYLFFVSKNDGSHCFSENIKEHNKAVRKYQKNNKNSKH